MASPTTAALEQHDQALLECILKELKTKGLNFAEAGAGSRSRPRVAHLLPPPYLEPVETLSESPSPSASSDFSASTALPLSTAQSVESSPLLKAKQLCMDADAWSFVGSLWLAVENGYGY
eukprot:Skav208558  [mRNA]  locus=scaffold1216:723608:724060:+ [translate_table: standard]